MGTFAKIQYREQIESLLENEIGTVEFVLSHEGSNEYDYVVKHQVKNIHLDYYPVNKKLRLLVEYSSDVSTKVEKVGNNYLKTYKFFNSIFNRKEFDEMVRITNEYEPGLIIDQGDNWLLLKGIEGDTVHERYKALWSNYRLHPDNKNVKEEKESFLIKFTKFVLEHTKKIYPYSHGDYNPNNIIITDYLKGTFTVIDWDSVEHIDKRDMNLTKEMTLYTMKHNFKPDDYNGIIKPLIEEFYDGKHYK